MENMDKGLTVHQMSAIKSAENTPAQAQKFDISMKKGFIGRP
jgi:hypothetical protein